MIIKVERSGGFAGIPISNEMDANDLPSELVTKLKKIMKNGKTSSLPAQGLRRGTADHFNYKISIRDGASKRVIECNQFNLQDDLKSVIRYLEKYSKTK